jgi:NAD(P)-dependent dehydrogenase (short-subunit alcohol dehydrogenase family)
VSEAVSFETSAEPATVAARPHPAKRRVTLITGASGGIGADLARVFARHGALVARSRDKLEALADEISATGRPRPLVHAVDLTLQHAVDQFATALDAAGGRRRFWSIMPALVSSARL